MSFIPFPGMDPFVEDPAHWKDFHHRFIDDLSDAIAERLPENYAARIGQDVLMLEHEIDGPDKQVEPDVLVSRLTRVPGAQATGRGTAMLEPVTIANVQRMDPYTEGFIEIRRLPNQEVVTVIEVLSRSNKSGDGRGMYLEKRGRLLQQPVGLVEIDLLRSGKRLELAKPLPAGDYYAFVSRADRRPLCDVFPWTLRDAVPTIPVPLSEGDGEIRIDLREPLSRTLRRGLYGRMIDYTQPPPPPSVSEADLAWIRTLAK